MKISQINLAMGEVKIRVTDLFDHPDLINKTGIEYVYQTNKSTKQIAVEATSGLPINGVEILILVTQSPDDYLPANSLGIHNELGLDSNSFTFDFNQGCSGFVQSFLVADSLIRDHKKILLVTADRYRNKLDPNDRSTNAVFSDAAAAMILDYDNEHHILFKHHLTDGSKRNMLFHSIGSENEGFLHMSGAELWMFTKHEVVPQINKAIDFCENNSKKIKGIYFHQASKLVVEGIKAGLKIDASLIKENYFKRGNTVSSTLPILIHDEPFVLAKDEVVIFAGFGVGLTSTVLVYGK
jgi:3-oxoacyl-[acyl-carrier-protein] synthase-3